MAKTRTSPAPKTAKAAPATATSAKGPGVIARLIHHLQHGGGTAQELFERLKADFPERGDGMLTTVKIQVTRLHKVGKLAIRKETVDGRGTVYSADPPVA